MMLDDGEDQEEYVSALMAQQQEADRHNMGSEALRRLTTQMAANFTISADTNLKARTICADLQKGAVPNKQTLNVMLAP